MSSSHFFRNWWLRLLVHLQLHARPCQETSRIVRFQNGPVLSHGPSMIILRIGHVLKKHSAYSPLNWRGSEFSFGTSNSGGRYLHISPKEFMARNPPRLQRNLNKSAAGRAKQAAGRDTLPGIAELLEHEEHCHRSAHSTCLRFLTNTQTPSDPQTTTNPQPRVIQVQNAQDAIDLEQSLWLCDPVSRLFRILITAALVT